jgi:hypothetical protein
MLTATNISNTNLSATNLTVSRFNLYDDITDISSTRLTYITTPSSLSIYHGLKSTLIGWDKTRATINIGLGRDQLHTNMGTYELLSGDVTISAGSLYGGTLINIANSQIMRNNASTLNKISTFGTTNFNELYYLDPARLGVISTAIYNTSTNNNNFSNTNEMGIMYINAGQETNFRTGIIRHRSPTTPEISKVSQFGTKILVETYYLQPTILSQESAKVTIESYTTETKADYRIDAGIINLISSRWQVINAPFIEITGPIIPKYAYTSSGSSNFNDNAIGLVRYADYTTSQTFVTNVLLKGATRMINSLGVYIITFKSFIYNNGSAFAANQIIFSYGYGNITTLNATIGEVEIANQYFLAEGLLQNNAGNHINLNHTFIYVITDITTNNNYITIGITMRTSVTSTVLQLRNSGITVVKIA